MKKLKHEDLLFPEKSEPEKPKRPPCPRCGSTHIQSRGMEWRCVDCRRTWAKELSPEIKEKLLKRKKIKKKKKK